MLGQIKPLEYSGDKDNSDIAEIRCYNKRRNGAREDYA